MIREWFKCTEPLPTWAILKDALESTLVKENELAGEAHLKDLSHGKEQNQDFTASEGTVLCRWDLKKIRELLFEVKDKWLDIGIELGVDIDVLLRIKMDFNIQADCLREMIRAWLKMYDPLPSLRSLCEVLQSKYVNAMELAEQASRNTYEHESLEIQPIDEFTGEQNINDSEIKTIKQGPNELCRWHVKQVREHLLDAKEKWMDIGIELEIDSEILEEIRQQHKDTAACLLEMIIVWLKFVDPKPTRDALINALKARAVKENDLAEALEPSNEDISVPDASVSL